ncbi:MAG TPA: antibiotic biosynthesis monooxygenase family protein [Anaerolineales bacterium]
MFGTIARLQIKPGMKPELKKVMAQDELAGIPGWVADYLFESADNPDECWLVAYFEDQAAYEANADSPEQHERYLKMRACLIAAPEWHDGTVISATGPKAVR